MPLVGLGTIILFVGWFGFNPGSTLGIGDTRLAEVAVVTLLGCAGGIIGAFVATQIKQKTIDIGMVANGAIAGLVAITAPSGYVEIWAGPIIGFVAGLIVVFGVIWIDKKIDDPVGATSAHGLAGIWGTLACGIFTAPRLAEYNAFGNPEGGLVYSGSFEQLIAQAVGVAGGVHVRVRDQLRDVRRHQGDDRPAGLRGGRRGGSRHRRARACTDIPSSSSRSRTSGARAVGRRKARRTPRDGARRRDRVR